MFYPTQGPLGTDSSWGMFTLTGNPAYYLLYRGITEGHSVLDEDGMTEEERQRR